MESTPVHNRITQVASLAVAILSIAGGCVQRQPGLIDEVHRAPESQITDIQAVDSIRDSGVRAAIISQHTLYSYHFVQNNEALNELGERDLMVLASYLRGHGGELNVRRDAADSALYNGRVQHVMDALRAQGVNTNQVHINDAPAGGAETLSENALREMRAMRAGSMQQSDSGVTPDQGQSSNVTGGQQ